MDNLSNHPDLSEPARAALAGVYAEDLTDLEVEVLNRVAPTLEMDGDAFERAVTLARPLLAEGLAVTLTEGLYDNGGAEDVEHVWLQLRLGMVDPSTTLLETIPDGASYMETSSETLYSVEDLDGAVAWR